jgi:phosphohistidine phosphatase
MTKLYFLRHGDAEDGMDDYNRRLSARGETRTATAARVMAALGIKPSQIFASPRIRAQRTAEIVAGALNVSVEIRDEVNFGFDVAAVRSLIADLPDDAEVLFVGHEPSMSGVVNALSGATVAMKKGGLARIDLFDRAGLHGTLVWLIAPRVFDVLDG